MCDPCCYQGEHNKKAKKVLPLEEVCEGEPVAESSPPGLHELQDSGVP